MEDLQSVSLGCDADSSHIATPIPKPLWHYTTYEAFQKIVTSKKIWATEHRFLNDRAEFIHAKKLADELLNERYGKDAPSDLRKVVESAFETHSSGDNALRIFVTCFSDQEDQLSQWRGYAGDSTGVSIGLDLQRIRPLAASGTMATFAPCVYKEDKKRVLLESVFEHYAQGSRAGQQILIFDLRRIAPLLKHESFAEEKEWRLVLPIDWTPALNPIEFRPRRDALVPYVSYPLTNPGPGNPIGCNELILGPGSHPSAED